MIRKRFQFGFRLSQQKTPTLNRFLKGGKIGVFFHEKKSQNGYFFLIHIFLSQNRLNI